MSRAILILDHGSKNADSNSRLARFAERIAAARPGWRVTHAHMELAEPDLPTAIEALVTAGATLVDVHLHFLGSGYHVQETIPELIDAARARHPEVRIRVSAPVGDDPRLAEIVIERLERWDDPASGEPSG